MAILEKLAYHAPMVSRSVRQVTLVLDPLYGFRAAEDAKQGPVWLIRSPKNAAAASELRQQYGDRSDHITVFDSCESSLVETLSDLIADIDLHHPGFWKLIVKGIPLTSEIQVSLGSVVTQELANGFEVRRHG